MMETPETKTYTHNSSPEMDHTHGKRHPRCGCRKALVLTGLMCLVVLLALGIVIENPWNRVYEYEVETDATREIHSPGHPGSPVPEGQVSMAREDVPEGLVVQEQEGQLHARRNAEEEQTVEPDAAVEKEQQQPPPFKLPIPVIPLPSDILDIPIKIPTHISDILGDLPLPTLPKDPGDIIDVLPTEPGDIISGIPFPTIPPAPTLPLPILPIPTKAPGGGQPPTPTRTGDDNPFPLPTILPPGKPKDPGGDLGGGLLPDLITIPHKILGLLHHAVSRLGNDDSLPRAVREMLRLIQRIIERVAGGARRRPKPTLSLPLPTLTLPPSLPIIPTLPPLPTDLTTLLPPIPPRPTLTLPPRARRAAGGAGPGEPLGDAERRLLKGAVSDEVWASVDWSNPIAAPLTAAAAMLAFDSVYWVAEALQGTEDEGEREELLGLLVAVDDDEDGDGDGEQ